MLILVVALIAAVISFLVMGILHEKRTRKISAMAFACSFRFSREDPFDIPQRYRDFVLISCGHSPRAFNVTYGQVDSWTLRSFDFRYEVGHGTRRMSRLYSVVVIDTQLKLPDVMMWNYSDSDNAPLEIMQVDGHIGRWSFTGNAKFTGQLCDFAQKEGFENISLQICNNTLLLSQAAGDKSARSDTLNPDIAVNLLRELKTLKGPQTDSHIIPKAATHYQQSS